MVGWRSSNFSAEGLLQLGERGQTWDTTNYYWELFNVNCEDGSIEPNPTSTLDNLIITREEVRFDIVDSNTDVIFSGRCYVSGYELAADNEGAMFYNADFKVTGVVY